MKRKHLVPLFSMILVVILGFGLFESVSNNKNQPTLSPSSTKIKIGVLQLLSHPALDSIYQGLQDELKNKGYEVGDNLEILFQNAQGDQSQLALMSEKLVGERPDVLVGITTPATLSLANITTELPIVMAGITYPVDAGLVKSEQRPDTNVTGVSDRTPIRQQLELMKQVIPTLKTVGILYTLSEDNSVKQVEEAKAAAVELGLSVEIGAIASSNDIQQITEVLASKVDAIFVPIDNTIASAMPLVVKASDTFKVGVFPSADTMVRDGGVLAIGVDQYQIGVKTAQVVVDVLQGKKPQEMPVTLMNEGVIYLNVNKAQELGITIPTDILEKSQQLTKETE